MNRLLLAFLLVSSLGVHCQSFTASNLPIVLIDTKGAVIADDPKIAATMQIIDNGVGKTNTLTDKPTFTSNIGIELRGSSSQLFPKKAYGIELRDATGENSLAQSVLGMPSESDWVLNAVYNDKTLIREALTYDFYRKMSKYYASRFRYCEVTLNGQYMGIYLMMERLKRDKNRVNITSIKKTDISGDAVTGGYILKIDKTSGSSSRSWRSPYGAGLFRRALDIQIDRPKPEDLADEQFQYIKKYVTDFEDALSGLNYTDPTNGWRKFADEESFIDYLLLSEICKNVDAYRLSAYFYKDRDSKNPKLVMGPIWDYNLTYGNAEYCEGNSVRGWAFDHDIVCPGDQFQLPFWWKRMLSDLAFGKKVKEKYKALRQTVLTPQRLGAFVDSTANVLTDARTRNFVKWPVIGVYVWPNAYVGPTYQSEVNFLKDWIGQRLAWMDGNIESFGQLPLATEPIAASVGPNPSVGDVLVSLPMPQAGDVTLTLTTTEGRSAGTFVFPNQPSGTFTHKLSAGAFGGAGPYVLRINTPTGPVSKVLVRE
ncbi:spore coat protein CotH [Fibrella aestuarina BUZ 2]|uniref:Spore coat protein CotH n=1 Tax=Fibrella aestuarina BUZ 2 TaxID=1166018 RepID=I0K7L2_9BACT|nr:CotH kinase family protein [Fibrella aestuarina]CCH00115.1 spore coat protein CotH [Fibrella aestuarina BUZ 2]